MSKKYKTVFTGVLEQLTAFSTGGGQSDTGVDSPLALDGAGRPVIRGQGLSGALIARARKLCVNIPAAISNGTPASQQESDERMAESVWLFHHAHPVEGVDGGLAWLDEWRTEVRERAAIRHDTGAAAEGGKYDIEVIPAGIHWWFCLEVDDYRDDSHCCAAIAAHTLQSWQECCLLGKDVVRGLGWMRLVSARVYQLEPKDAAVWPNAEHAPIDQIQELQDRGQNLDDYVDKLNGVGKPTRTWHRKLAEVEISIESDNHDAAWGVEALSVGMGGKNGHDEFWAEELTGKNTLGPRADKDDYFTALEPDNMIAWTLRDGIPQPCIPGSSIRGVLRHTLSWLFRKQGCKVSDPLSGPDETKEFDPAARLFGLRDEDGGLYISDADMPDPEDWTLLVLQQHAEDELAAGVCGAKLFNRSALLSGKFRFRYLLEADSEPELEEMEQLLEQAWRLGGERFLPLGGGVYRGFGWVAWERK